MVQFSTGGQFCISLIFTFHGILGRILTNYILAGTGFCINFCKRIVQHRELQHRLHQ